MGSRGDRNTRSAMNKTLLLPAGFKKVDRAGRGRQKMIQDLRQSVVRPRVSGMQSFFQPSRSERGCSPNTAFIGVQTVYHVFVSFKFSFKPSPTPPRDVSFGTICFWTAVPLNTVPELHWTMPRRTSAMLEGLLMFANSSKHFCKRVSKACNRRSSVVAR